MGDEYKARLLAKMESRRAANAADPLFLELQTKMTSILRKLREAYFQRVREVDLMDEIVYEATWLLRGRQPPDFDTTALEEAAKELCDAFGDRGMTRDLALGQIIYDASRPPEK